MSDNTAHETTALDHVRKAEGWANYDGALDDESRARLVDYHLRLAQIHATLSVSQQLNIGLA